MASNTKYPLPLEKLYQWERSTPDRVFLRQPYPGRGYTDLTWRQVADQVRRIAAALKQKGLPPGSHVAILSKNCAHWMMADFAIWMAGHVSVPLYPNLNESTVRQILEHADCKLAFIGKLDDVAAYRRGVPAGMPCIAFPYHEVDNAERWDDLVAATSPLTGEPQRQPEELATIIYTSGTTGEPKGVMHAFKSFAVAGTEILGIVPITQEERFFSYLPLAHVAERILVETVALYAGASIAFAESIDTFAQNLQTIQPTVFLSVPRLWQKFQSGVLGKLPQKKLDVLLRIPVVSGLIKKKVKRALGLGQVKLALAGAAATPPSLIEWFSKLGIQIQEAYGMTENFAYSHFNRTGQVLVGSVGQPWPLVKTRISAEGEIQVATPCDFLGYYKSPVPRESLFDGEYFKTGDRGEITPSGHLKITGRTKDLFKTSKGKYVAPSPIESQLATSPHLEAVCVVGSGMASPIALAVPSAVATGTPKDEVARQLSETIAQVNAKLDPHERVARLVLVKEAWTVANGAITPTMKVKRDHIEKRYGSQLERWSSGGELVVWES